MLFTEGASIATQARVAREVRPDEVVEILSAVVYDQSVSIQSRLLAVRALVFVGFAHELSEIAFGLSPAASVEVRRYATNLLIELGHTEPGELLHACIYSASDQYDWLLRLLVSVFQERGQLARYDLAARRLERV